jgi:hypothetical protein
MESMKKMRDLLFFNRRREDLANFSPNDLALGLFVTWLVGMGRYWDDPGAMLFQHLGLGSLVYIFVLSFFIYLLLLPFRIEGWDFLNLLTFISFTSMPAALYAIPVERFIDINTAASMNAWFLAIVAMWRVALLIFYLNVFAQLKFGAILVAVLLPLTLIVTALSSLNLERAVFELMGGLREQTSNDSAYATVLLLTMLSWLALIPALLGYIFIVFSRNFSKTR